MLEATLYDIQKIYGENVYPLYKDIWQEPYLVEESGFGFSGIVLYDEVQDKIQCANCGEWLESLGGHCIYKHGKSIREYKIEHGIYMSTPLVTQTVSAKMHQAAMNRILSYKAPPKNLNKTHTTLRKRNMWKITANAAMTKNKFGTCSAQIAARLQVIREITGNQKVSTSELKKYDYKLYQVLAGKFGSIRKASKNYNLEFTGSGRFHGTKFSDAVLIGKLRLFVQKYQRMPLTKDMKHFDELHSPKTYIKFFGSWRRAKMIAGLELLLNKHD